MNYYRRFMGDYQRDTGHLSLMQHGVYTVLLDHYYSKGGPLPASLEALYRLCRAMTKVEQGAVETVAAEFFPIGEDGLRHNKRADAEIANWAEYSAEQRRKGKLGGRGHKATANPEQSRGLAGVKPSTSTSIEEDKSPATRAPIYESEDPTDYLIWVSGIQLLGEPRRGLLARLVKEHGRDLVARKLGELMAMPEKPRDPAGYFIGCMRKLERRFQP